MTTHPFGSFTQITTTLSNSAITVSCCLFMAAMLKPADGYAAGTEQQPARPNILLIVADDLGYGDLSCYGATRIKTPNIDRLAAQGIRFTQGYAPSSTCTPTRYSILTGEYAWRQPAKKTGILDGDAPLCIAPGRFTLPAMLQASGYKTGVVGKWHLGLGDGQTAVDFNQDVKPGPNEIGFGYSYIIPATVDRVPSVWIENSRVVNLDPSDPIRVSYTNNISDGPCGIERPDLLKQGADKQHAGVIHNGISRIGYMSGGKKARFKDEELASTVVKKSIDYITGNTNNPFFLYVGFFEPHVPRVAESPFVKTSSCGVRGDVIQQLDWATGEILKALDRMNLSDNTLVLLTSDNGPIFFDGYFDRSVEEANGHLPAGALRGYKYLVYEGACRVPLIARWPTRVTPRVSNHLFNLVDLFATLAPLAGAKMPPAVARDSIDLSSTLLNQDSQPLRDHTILHGLSDTLAIRQGDWKYIPSNTHQVPAGMGRGANPSDARFSESRIPEPLLFNLAEDPGEKNNVIQNHPQIADALRKRLLLISAVSPLPATDYYVHPVTGNDANTGTDIRAPWKTLEKASSAPLKPGDRVLFAGGQTFKGQLLLQGLAGTPKKPITFSSYRPQTATSREPRATIDARGYLAAVHLADCKHITIADLIVTADGGGMLGNHPKKADMRCGLLVKAEADGDYAGFCLTNLLVRDVSFEERGFVRPPSDVNTANGTTRYGWGIRFIAESPRTLLRDITVIDCTISNVDHTGLKFTAPSNGLQNVHAERITVENSGGPGIQMSGVRGGHFTHLYVNGSGSTNDTRNWGRGSGLWTWSTRDVIIEKSQFLNANGPGDSAGVHIDYHCRNVIVQYNLSANNAGGFCEILGNNYNCAYRYNVSVNDGHRVKGEKGAFQEGKTFWLSGYVGGKNRRGPYNSYFYNNTIYVSSNIVSKVAVAPTTEGVFIANNIFYLQGKTQLVIGDQSRADSGKAKQLKNIVFENNLYLRADNWPRDVLIQDRAPRIGNPVFRNPGGLSISDYIPRNEKAVKNQGILIQKIPEDDIGLTIGLKPEHDILGNPIVNGPDMGAIEMR